MSESPHYRVIVARAAEKGLVRAPKEDVRRIRLAIRALAQNPRPHGYIKLVNRGDQFRIRVGDWRVIYEVMDEVLVVLVIKIANRSDVYR